VYLLILIFPFISAIIAGIGGFYFGKKISTRISIGCMFIAALISLFLFFEICLSDSIVIIKLFT
jgi:NADH:ubiquinone oxidoreductase subunit 5 (subunit L)/multisubunit Na+/H+ antiporter MnhA subunit